MTCGGCSGAVERVLKRLDGIVLRITLNSLFRAPDPIAD